MNAPASQKASFKVNGKIENTISRDLVHQPSDKKKHLPASSLKLERVEEIQASVFRQFSRVWVKVIHWSMELKSSVKQDHEVCFEKSDFTFERGEQKQSARGAAAMDFSLIKWSVSRKTTLM